MHPQKKEIGVYSAIKLYITIKIHELELHTTK